MTGGLLTIALAGCATPGSDIADDGIDAVNDPLEPLNRTIFAANQAVDFAVIRPVSYAYREAVPQVFQDRVTDFLRNLRSPIIVINELLQGDWRGAEAAATRFFINTTLGVGGLVDIANYNGQGIPFEREDFGQTLAVWGIGEGPYLVLPLLGPSNPRDAIGLVVDTLADPVNVIANSTDNTGLIYGRAGATIISGRAASLDATDELERTSVDYYATVRSLYRQLREADIRDGAVDGVVDIPDFDIPDYEPPAEEAPPASDDAGAVDIPDFGATSLEGAQPAAPPPVAAAPAPIGHGAVGELQLVLTPPGN